MQELFSVSAAGAKSLNPERVEGGFRSRVAALILVFSSTPILQISFSASASNSFEIMRITWFAECSVTLRCNLELDLGPSAIDHLTSSFSHCVFRLLIGFRRSSRARNSTISAWSVRVSGTEVAFDRVRVGVVPLLMSYTFTVG